MTLVQCLYSRPEPEHDRHTNSRKFVAGWGSKGLGDSRVLARSHCWSVLLVAAAVAGLAGCGVDPTQPWFVKPFDVSGRSAGYSFSELSETKKERRALTANDYVNANGSCPAPVAATPAAPASAAQGAPGAAPSAPAADTSSLLGGGLGLGMSECEVVFRAGPPSSVQIGSLPNGDRTAVLTFQSGPRPGIYRFVRGEMTEMDAVATPAAPPEVAKKKLAKPKKSASN